jgi:hypothetical protein
MMTKPRTVTRLRAERPVSPLRAVRAPRGGERLRPAWGALYLALIIVGAFGSLVVWHAFAEDTGAGLVGIAEIITLAIWVRWNRAALARWAPDTEQAPSAEPPRFVRSRRPPIDVPTSTSPAPPDEDDRVVLPYDFR